LSKSNNLYKLEEIEIAYSEIDEFSNKKPTLTSFKTYALNDSNDKQVLDVSGLKACTLKLTVRSFYDLYGRVIVYNFKIFS
jgi:hypothetical protein